MNRISTTKERTIRMFLDGKAEENGIIDHDGMILNLGGGKFTPNMIDRIELAIALGKRAVKTSKGRVTWKISR